MLLYAGVSDRTAADADRHNVAAELVNEGGIANVIKLMLDSSEFSINAIGRRIPAHSLPSLRERSPDYYRTDITDYGEDVLIFDVSKREFDLLESWIDAHRYYDVPGVWGSKIDLGQEADCRNRPGTRRQELSRTRLLYRNSDKPPKKAAGVQVVGLDTSHLAFVLAYPNIRDDMIFADLLAAELNQKFDVVLADGHS